MQQLLGDEWEAFEKTAMQPPTAGLRANTLKLSPERFREISPFRLEPLPWTPTGFLLSGEYQPGKHPYHAAGLYYLQEPSAMAVAELLDPQPGERVLDLAAAPGGKTTHLAALMQNQGLLIANEVHPQRAWELAENLERWGARQAAVLQETPARLAERWEGFFDRVLLDAPCSGEGMFRKSEAARREWTPELPHSCALRQAGILESAALLVRPGGRLAYSTCTFAPRENEGVIARFLSGHPDFELVEARRFPGFASGRPDWVDEGAAPGEQMIPNRWAVLSRSVRLWPHRLEGEGHFVALLERGPKAGAMPVKAAHLPAAAREANLLFDTFRQENLQENLSDTLEELRPVQMGSYLYAVPPGLPDVSGLKVLHPGWWLGEIKKNRFQASHALALALRLDDARNSANLDSGSMVVYRYLRGETFSQEGEDGWVLVAVDGFPLGWGKRVQGVVKNHYPHGLRWS